MKIVFLDRDSIGSDIAMDVLHKLGDVQLYRNTTTQEEAMERIKDAEIVIANKAPLTQKVLDSAFDLKYIAITATGYNNVDLAYCTERGIKVSNVRGYSTASVAQHTFAMALYLMEKLDYYNAYVKSGDYSRQDFFTHFSLPFYELEGKTWGVVGLGNIGTRVGEIATAFGCRVIYYSTGGNHDSALFERVDFNTLLEESDVISVHCPLTEQTRNLFDLDAMKRMQGNAILLNLARGPVVCEEDLITALEEEYIAGAGLDVFETEPLSKDSKLLSMQDNNKLILTPHTAWATVEARERCFEEVIKNIEAFLEGKERNIVKL